MNSINSQEYWDERFTSGNWVDGEGRQQTSYFYRLLMEMMPQWLKQDIVLNHYSMTDFGCAEGQGVPVIAAELGNNILGVDFSTHAITNAKELYPDFRFEVGNILNYARHNDVSFASNVIEHFDEPFDVLDHIASITDHYLVVMIPLEEENLMPEHKYTFRYSNIPIAVGAFQLVHYAEHDCRNDECQLFLAKQILLVYSRKTEINRCISIDTSNGIQKKLDAHLNALQQLDLNIKAMQSSISSMERSISESSAKDLDEKNTAIHNLTNENTRLVQLYNETQQKHLELVARFNSLNDAYSAAVADNAKIKASKTYRLSIKIWETAAKLHLIGFIRMLLLARYIGLRKAMQQWRGKRAAAKNQSALAPSIDASAQSNDGGQYEDANVQIFHYRQRLYKGAIEGKWNEKANELYEILSTRSYKGIVVYPHAVHWEPVQRPHHILRTLAEDGFLCFFCDDEDTKDTVEEKEHNLFVIYKEKDLVAVLQSFCPLILTTFHLQAAFIDALPHKTIWFDLIDDLDFFCGGDSDFAKEIYGRLIKEAAIVSYSADNLQPYIAKRKDAIKLNNGVALNDFISDNLPQSIPYMEKIKASCHGILGYYGAIEEWFDKQAIQALLANTDYDIVLIGKVGIDLTDLKNNRLHIIGPVPYAALPNYARYFDIALIPFIKNKLTDSVSPVKFYEYVAQGLPVISSDIHEMRQYQTKQVCIYHDLQELVSLANSLYKETPDKCALKKIAEENTWHERVQLAMNSLIQTKNGLNFLADYKLQSDVSVETVTFFQYDGSTYYSGGAERYLLDLAEISNEMNISYRIYQYGEFAWVRFYGNVEVVGMKPEQNDVHLFVEPLVKEMSRTFCREASQAAKLKIYSPFYIMGEKGIGLSMGISHGVSWDSEFNHFTDGNSMWSVNKNVIDSANEMDRMISVDTNTCNWFQTLDYDTGRKISYVPNYVDNKEFCPRPNYLEPREKIVITYPRRLYGARGLYVVLDTIDDILEKYPNVEFHFVGKGFESDTKHVEKKIKKWGNRVQWYSKAPNQMSEVYKQTDIALIPTMYSEGTSLSCLEALSSGNVVIATRIGGLPDLILSGYNGILVEPNGSAIKTALFNVLDNSETMQTLKKNAVATAQAFSKEKWKKQWKGILSECITDTSRQVPVQRCLIKLESEDAFSHPETLQLVMKYLQDGWYVFVACKGNSQQARSYKRLQFIDLDADLYFEPEQVIHQSEISVLLASC